jgi:phosphate transport system protein
MHPAGKHTGTPGRRRPQRSGSRRAGEEIGGRFWKTVAVGNNQRELDQAGHALAEMARLVAEALSRATEALLEADLRLAETVISGDSAIDALYRELDVYTPDALAGRQPVARDLRALVTSLRMSADLERMGDLARHIATVARMRFPDCAVPEELRETFAKMGEIGVELARKVVQLVTTKDLGAAGALDARDDAVDRLHRGVFTTLLTAPNPYAMQTAIDVTLLSRYYERFADHAVSVARRVEFLTTGEPWDE